MSTTLSDYVAASQRYRCLPNLGGGEGQVPLLRIFSLEQLRFAVENRVDALAALSRTECTRQQTQLLEVLRERCTTQQGFTLCNLSLLEKHASVLPDAFFSHCDSLRSSFSAFPRAQLHQLYLFRSRMPDSLQELGPRLIDLVLAPTSSEEAVDYFHQIGLALGVKIEEPSIQLLNELQHRAGPLKTAFPLRVGGTDTGTSVNPTLKDFVTDELKLLTPYEPKELYVVFEYLSSEEFGANATKWQAGLYNYLTATSAKFKSAAPLPQMLLNTLLHNMTISLARLLLIVSVGFNFLDHFTTSKQPKQILELLRSYNAPLHRLAEFLAIPHQTVFHRLDELFSMENADCWKYEICNRPWMNAASYRAQQIGPLGIVQSEDLARQLADSDYNLCFKLTGLTPDRSLTLAETKAQSLLFSRLVDGLANQEGNPLLEKLLYSIDFHLAPTPEPLLPELLAVSQTQETEAQSEVETGWSMLLEFT